MNLSHQQELLIILIAGTLLFLVLVLAIILFVIYFQRRRHQHTIEITDMKNKYEAALLQSQLEIQEQTLKTISQEIHDNIGQVLTLAKLQLHSLGDECTKLDLQPTKDLISKSINDLRDLSKSLNPERITDIGLVESLRHELQVLEKTGLMQTKLEVHGAASALPPGKNVIVFRIFQELMHNAIRHSGATFLTAELFYDADQVALKLSDNGKGFDESVEKGIGLTSMQSRAAMMHAHLQIDSNVGKGTIATLTVPFERLKNKEKT